MLEILAKLQEMGLTIETANFQTGQITIRANLEAEKASEKETEKDEQQNLIMALRAEILYQASLGQNASIIPAILQYRKMTGLSLTDSKEVVEKYILDNHLGYKTESGWFLYR